ncbi:MAG: hypothetical protein KKE20_01885, partial [Nanoarchaeota archaeon]|nr:hypothetical protein [Nanoarchaeota archaeon]
KQPEPVKPKKPLFGAFVNGVGAAGTSLSRSLFKSLSSFGSGVKKHSARVWKYSKELDSKVIDKSESFLKSIKNAFPAQKPVKPADQEELISRMGKKPVRKPGVIEVIEPKKIEWEKPQKAKKSLFPIISKSIMSAGRSAAHKIKEHSMKGLALSKKFDNYLLSKIKESYQKSKKSISKISIPKIPRGPGPVKPSVQQPQKAAVEPEKEKAIERVKWIDVHKDVQEKLQKEKQNKIEKEKSRKLREKRMQEFSSRIKDNVSKALSFSEKLDQDVIRIARDYYTKSKDFLAKGIAPSRKMSNHKKRMAELHAQREKEHKNMLMKEKKELQATLAKERQQKIMMAKFHQQHNAQQARKGKESWNRSISKAKSLISSVSSRSASAAARIKKNLLNLESSGIAKAKQEKRIVAKIIHDDEEKMHTYFRRLKKRTVSSGSAGAASIKAASRSSKRTYDNLALKAKSILKRYSRKAKDIESSMIEEIKPKKRSFLKKKR